jgi:glucose-1-phosphate thymidylyltransferase
MVKGVILSGGLGTRLRPLTHTGVKQIIPVANKPVIEYCIDDLVSVGVQEIAIIVGYTPDKIQSVVDTVGDGSRWGIAISYIEQDGPRGIAHAIACARDFVGTDSFIVYLGDNLLQDNFPGIIQPFIQKNVDMGLLLTPVDDPRPYGVAILDESGKMVDIIEKPANPPSNLAVIGIYYFSAAVFPVIEQLTPSARGELEVSDTIHAMFQMPDAKIAYATTEGWWDDTGTAEAILLANHKVLRHLKPKNDGEIEPDVQIIGDVSIGSGTVIHSGTVLRGPLIIGADCEIGPTYIGPYSSIGDRTIIKGGELESVIIVGDAYLEVEADTRICDSLIGRHTKMYSAAGRRPHGYRLTIGENSEVYL